MRCLYAAAMRYSSITSEPIELIRALAPVKSTGMYESTPNLKIKLVAQLNTMAGYSSMMISVASMQKICLNTILCSSCTQPF